MYKALNFEHDFSNTVFHVFLVILNFFQHIYFYEEILKQVQDDEIFNDEIRNFLNYSLLTAKETLIKLQFTKNTTSCPKFVIGHLIGKYCRDSRQQPAGMTDDRLYLHFPNCSLGIVETGHVGTMRNPA